MLIGAGIKVDVLVAAGSTAEDHAVGVEGGGGDGGAAVLEEAGVRLDARELGSVCVEDFYGMCRSTPEERESERAVSYGGS